MEERRPAVRVVVNLKASYGPRAENGKADALTPYSAWVSEISATGLRLKTSEPLRFGETITVVFAVEGRDARVALRLVARVIRLQREDESSFEYALRITDDAAVTSKMRQAVLMVSLGAVAQKSRRAPDDR